MMSPRYLTLLLMMLFVSSGSGAETHDTLSLAGTWHFDLAKTKTDAPTDMPPDTLHGTVKLPGSMSENGLGDPITTIIQQVWGGRTTSTPVWNPMIRMDYRGAAWYQQEVTIPPDWKDRFVQMFLERVCWQSELWVDNTRIGQRDSLSAPHQYDLGLVTPGTHRLTLRIDNRKMYELGCNTHGYHEASCTIFNGVIGEMTLRARSRVIVRDDQVHADPDTGICELRTTVVNHTTKEVECSFLATIVSVDGDGPVGTVKTNQVVPPGESPVTLSVSVPKSALKCWSEFAQPLYVAKITLASPGGVDNHEARFGFRRYETRGAQFFINGKPVLLRGETNNAQFPLTGHPPMAKDEWLKIFRLYKDFGINHMRFHAWVPPEAAFAAADEVGLYLQPELPNGEDSITKDTARGLPWRQDEFDRILDTYGNHPSFVQMTMGNEAKTKQIDFLKGLVQRGRQRDSRHLYASISNPEASGIRDEVPGDDFAVAHGGSKGRRRMETSFNREIPETVGDYRKTMVGRPVPQISHETGQWYVYPDPSEIDQYTGVLRPVQLEHFRDVATKTGALPQVPDFVRASGQLSLLLYKEEIERSLRTPQYGGFHLLSLQDNFDQGSAFVGQINMFFAPKSYVTAKIFREFCSSQVPLARLAKRVWLNNETFTANIELANYGPAPLTHATVAWQLLDGQHELAQGAFGPLDIPDTGLQPIGRISQELSGLTNATKVQLLVSVPGTEIRNRWDIWVYPVVKDEASPARIKVVSTLDAATLGELHGGARVVLLPAEFKSTYVSAMTTPFWSPFMFSNQRQLLGLLIDSKHPALRQFPTDSYSNWQWYDLLFQGSAILLEGLPVDYRPIVQGIDRPDRNQLLGLVYEGKVGQGSLLVCTLDLNLNLDKRPVARHLRRSLLAYAASTDFHPSTTLDVAKQLPVTTYEDVLPHLSPIVSADSEHENHWATFAVDGNPQTIWQTRSDGTATPPPHQLTVKLKEPLTITGFLQTPCQDNDNGRIAKYRLHVSDDGQTWRVVAEGTWPNSPKTQRVNLRKPIRTLFIRLEGLSEVGGRMSISVAEFDVTLK